MTRYKTLFSIRYAVRVLERYSRLWQRIDTCVRIAALLAGSSAFASLIAESRPLTLLFGILFAIFQAIEFAIRPAEKTAAATAQRRPYAALLVRQADFDDASLEAAYQAVVADDDIVVPESVKPLAYNDVGLEKGCDPSHLIVLSRWQRFVGIFA